MDLKKFFTDDLSAHQRQYEAIRAIAFSEGTYMDIAKSLVFLKNIWKI